MAKERSVEMTLKPFELSQVRLLEGTCKAAQEANRRYLHRLDSDRLLYNFRVNAGLDAPGEPLGGWEKPDCEVRGHFVGHYLSACALMYASTGDEALKFKADKMVSELAKCQKVLGGEYLSAFPESFWDRLESMQQIPWAAYYTVHKIMAGMYDMYTLCRNQQALDVLKGMASYFKKRIDRLSGYQIDQILSIEFGGMSEVLHNLYAITKDPDHLRLAHTFDRAAFLGPLALEHDNLSHLHGNTHIPIICGAARHYELTGDERYRTATRYFWDRIANTRSYATGGSTMAEVWSEPNKLANTLAPNNQECCKTHNMLKVTRYLMRWTGDPAYADFYERAFFNGIMGTQEPATGMLMYYVSLATGYPKVYGTPNDSFWCCYGTGVESFAKLGDSIYFHDDKGIYVNLFIASTVRWDAKGVRLEQITRFPEEEGTTFIFHTDQPAELALSIHVPYWATQGVRVKVNGRTAAVQARPTSYLRLRRKWKEGDRVEVAMPMNLHLHPMPDDPELAAIMYGPLVLAGIIEPERSGEPVFAGYDPMSQSRPPASQEFYFLADAGHLSSWIKSVPGEPLAFRTVGQPTDITFIPLSKVVTERYGVYWVITQKDSPRHHQIREREEARKAREARIVDRVIPGDRASEAMHNLKGENTASGVFASRAWRHAASGGWWSWDLRVLPDLPMTLACTYWGDDVGPRTFDILVDEKIIATQSLNRNKPGQFFEAEYPVPMELTRSKERVTVRFRAHQGNMAGGVFECAILK